MAKERHAIFIRAHLPLRLVNKWMQHVRDFDRQHPDCHFEMVADDMGLSVPQMVEMMRVDPGLTFTQIITRAKT